MTGSKFRNLEPCSLENIGEPLYNKYDLECKHFSTAVYDEDAVDQYDWGGLRFDQINVTSLLNEKLTKDFKLKTPKIIEYKSDYLELIRFLKKDIINSKFEFTKELGNLLSICAKYNCKLVLSPEILDGDSLGIFVPNYDDDFKYIIILIREENEQNYFEYTSTKDFIKTLRHEVFHLIQSQYEFEVLGIDIFDKSAKEILDLGLYKNCSIKELISEFEAFSVDKVPFMACEIESHLSQFSSIEDNKYAASSKRIKTIELIARERRIPIYSKKDKSIFLEDKEIEKIFNEELSNLKNE